MRRRRDQFSNGYPREAQNNLIPIAGFRLELLSTVDCALLCSNVSLKPVCAVGRLIFDVHSSC